MFATFFQWRIAPGQRLAFEDSWAEITRALREQGSHGSALFESEDGTLCAFARWPDRATRDRAFALGLVPDAASRMRGAIGETLHRIDMAEVRNLWKDLGA